LHQLADAALAGSEKAAADLRAAGQVLGLLNVSAEAWFRGDIDQSVIDIIVQQRVAARAAKDFKESDRLRDVLLHEHGVIIEDGAKGAYTLRKA
jgi:cysteinyl-tRNA synthetase